MPSTLRWLLIHTSMPALISSRAISAWMSEKPIARSGLSFEYLADLRTGERRDFRLFLACPRRPHGEAGDADDALIFTQCIEHFGGFLGKADDALRVVVGHGVNGGSGMGNPTILLFSRSYFRSSVAQDRRP